MLRNLTLVHAQKAGGPSCPLVGMCHGFRSKSLASRKGVPNCPILLIYGLFFGDWTTSTTSCCNTQHLSNSQPYWKTTRAPECVARNGDADVYVATDRRIIHFKTDFWKKSISKVTPYLYNDIKTFRADMAFASSGCILTITGGVKTLHMKKGDRQRFATVVRSHVSTHQTDESISGQAAQPATSQPPSAEKKSKRQIGGCAIMIVLAGLGHRWHYVGDRVMQWRTAIRRETGGTPKGVSLPKFLGWQPRRL